MKLDLQQERRKLKNKEIRALVDEAQAKCEEFFETNYYYNDSEAVEELGLDSELIEQLVEDYVIQIIKSSTLFKEHLQRLKAESQPLSDEDYRDFRELAHKNLGVARNLRIKDSEEILTKLMHQDNLDELEVYLSILEACAIKLKPLCAYNTLELIKIKQML